ncbi:MAG: hypothetical protein AAF990_27350 [Bacteroidota bacterium]
MKARTSIHQTFDSIRCLPLEVSFQQVENWVHQYRPDAVPPSTRWQRFIAQLNHLLKR